MTSDLHDLLVIGGGAAGFFGAITAAELGAQKVLILEKGPEVLTKVRISGGGRCNVTHDCYDPRELIKFYPRGIKNLIGPFSRFQPADTITWFAERGVTLNAEPDGRLFPSTNRSETIIDCLTTAAHRAGVTCLTRSLVTQITSSPDQFTLTLEDGRQLFGKNLLVASGGIRHKSARLPADTLGLTSSSPVPSLFTFKISHPFLNDLQGTSVPFASIKTLNLTTQGPLLITHWGLSGPAILKASAWKAREIAESHDHFPIEVNWLGDTTADEVAQTFTHFRQNHGARQLTTHSPFPKLTKRLWNRLTQSVGLPDSLTWSKLARSQAQDLTQALLHSHFLVEGKSLNKDEFVTCGGVSLDQLNLKTFESKTVPRLYFAGEVLDLDGLTGGFNFQAAWTTAFLAGTAIAESLVSHPSMISPKVAP